MAMKMSKRRRIKPEKTIGSRDDDLPWAVPIPFDPTFLPTALFKTALTPLLFPSSSIQSILEPYYSRTIENIRSNFESSSNQSANMESGQGGYDSGGVSSPTNPNCLAQASSGSCPAISVVDGPDYSGKLEVSSKSNSNVKNLPPVGVFWDIENCAVPRGRSALLAVQRIRERFFFNHLEAEFVTICDVSKQSRNVVQELNDAQVSVVHVAGNSKNAADDKLRQAMRRFADISCSNPMNSSGPYPATIILISGDINFATDLSDLRYRKRLYIILLHNMQTPNALLVCAHEHYVFNSLLSDLPFRTGYKDYTQSNLCIPLKGGVQRVDALVMDLPSSNAIEIKNFVRIRLRRLSENCGGKVMTINGHWALIRFPNFTAALRACKRMNGEDVLGHKIRVVCSSNPELGSLDSYPYPTADSQEEAFEEGFNMQTNKSNQGFFNSPSWKPTWRRTSESFRQGSSRHHHHVQHHHPSEANRYNAQSTTAASNSSTPNETSRDGSPNVLKPHNLPSVQSVHLNNSTQFQQSSQVNVPASSTAVGSPVFAFHQNLYPNNIEAGMNASMRQECSTPSQQHLSELNGASGPRLYSTLNSSDGSASLTVPPLGANNQHNFNMQLDLNKFSSPPVGTGIMMAPIQASAMESQATNVMTGPTNCNTGNYAKFRNSDGESFDLNVTNIDPSLGDWKTIRSALNAAFSEHVSVRGIWVYTASDGSVSAVVRLSNKDDAHFSVAQLHRRKLGNKRIFISFDQGVSVDIDTLKKEVASLLLDVPNHTLPLFKFREMFEKRYKRSISSSDLYRMKDVVQISETTPNGSNGMSTASSGRNISLTTDWQKKDGKGLDLYCKLHPRSGRKTEKDKMGWAEKEAEVMLPNVIVEIKVLVSRVQSLVLSHQGNLPLISFLDCYEAEFGSLERANEGRGVPLEHLISCVHGVEIVHGENGMKQIRATEKKDGDYINFVNPQLQTQFTQFGRELIDLLKTFPKCTLPFAKLIPSYHAHFGRQCRVADYGHFSLSALLQTLPHIVQIMGAAQNRVLTLSHRAQMKRFATDTLRVLKSQGGIKKQICIEDFPAAFSNVFPNRQFQPEDYGLCFFSDLVEQLVEQSTLVALVKDEDGNSMLAVPKREQTPQEIHKTRIFAAEVVELLRHSTRCELEFSKFVPYYHHHFQKQCRVSDYGFSKLAELFDAIIDTVVIFNPGRNESSIEDKIIRLTPKEQTKVVGEQVCKIVEKRLISGRNTRVEELVECFLDEHGFLLRPDLCDATDLEDLVYNKLENYVKVENGEIVPIDRIQIEEIAQKAESILQQTSDYTMELTEFLSALSDLCVNIEINEVSGIKDMGHILSVVNDGESQVVKLEPLRIFAFEVSQLLEVHGGQLPLPALESSYFEKFGRPLQPAKLGYPTVLPMLQAIPDVVSLRGKHRTKRVIVLNSSKSALESSVSDESSASTSNGMQTPRNGSLDWKYRDSRSLSTGSAAGSRYRYGRHGEWSNSPKRRSALPPPLFSPLNSPTYVSQPIDGNSFGFDRPTPLSPPVYDVWMQESVPPGSPPVSPPLVWTMHPVYYPSSPPPGGPGNILVTSPYVGPAPWSPPPVNNNNCYDRVPPQQQTVTMLGNEFLFGQNRLTASFEGLTIDSGSVNEG